MTQHKTIQSIRRLNNSPMGNPAFSFVFTDGTRLRTKANISDAYSVCMSWEGRTVKIETHTTKSGKTKITSIEG